MTVRVAVPADVAVFDVIERSAGTAFSRTEMAEIADAGACPPAVLYGYVDSGRAWVAVDEDQVCGYLILDVLGNDAHIEQVSVHQRLRGKRHGAALIHAAAVWAREHGYKRLTLTTFQAVPWNQPYYERLGFDVLSESAWTHELRERVAHEAAHGLNRWPRVVMARPTR